MPPSLMKGSTRAISSLDDTYRLVHISRNVILITNPSRGLQVVHVL